jgi:hypothetical protein
MSTWLLGALSYLPRPLRETIVPDMRIPEIQNDPSKVQLARIGYVAFEHPDLREFDKFAVDFGFVEAKREEERVHYRGYGRDPYCYVAIQSKDKKPHFRGPAFVAKSQEEFDKAVKLPGAQVSEITDAPGGGKMVTFDRPDDTTFRVIFGQEEREVDPQDCPSATHESQGAFNLPLEKPRKGQQEIAHLTSVVLTSMNRHISAIPRWPSSCPQTWPLRIRVSAI